MLNFWVCPPGSYSSRTGSIRCHLCPTGTICQGFGNVVPMLCPPGFTCDVIASSVPSGVCPAGTFCLKGSINATIDLINATEFQSWLNLRPNAAFKISGIGALVSRNNVDYFAENSFSVKPVSCSFYTFCDYGTVSNLTNFKNNQEHFAKFCLVGSNCEIGMVRQEGDVPLPGGYYIPTNP